MSSLRFNDLDYHPDKDHPNPEHGGFNERYVGQLKNTDIIEIRRYGYYENRNYWEWAVYHEDKYPYQCIMRSFANAQFDTPEEAFSDFDNRYEEKPYSKREPETYRCLKCGWVGDSSDIENVTVYEDYGDVGCLKCPSCKSIQYDGMHMFEKVD